MAFVKDLSVGHVGNFGDNGQVGAAEPFGRLPVVASPIKAGDLDACAQKRKAAFAGGCNCWLSA